MISNLLNFENFKLIFVGFRKLIYLKYCKIYVGFIIINWKIWRWLRKNELRRLFEYFIVLFIGVFGEFYDYFIRFGGLVVGYCSS